MMDKFKQFILGVSPQLSLTSLEQLRKITVLKEYQGRLAISAIEKT